MISGSDVEGRLAVGRDAAIITAWSVAQGTSFKCGAQYAMIVNGMLTWPGDGGIGCVGINGKQIVAGETDGEIKEYLRQVIQVQPGYLDWIKINGAMRYLSCHINSMAQSGTVARLSDRPNVIRLGCGDGNLLVYVFQFEASNLRNVAFESECNDRTTLLINVAGQLVHLSGDLSDKLISFAPRLIWNFFEATTINIHDIGLQGTVLAPYAAFVEPQGVIWGHVFAESYSGCFNSPSMRCPAMQINWVPWIGCIPIGTSSHTK